VRDEKQGNKSLPYIRYELRMEFQGCPLRPEDAKTV